MEKKFTLFIALLIAVTFALILFSIGNGQAPEPEPDPPLHKLYFPMVGWHSGEGDVSGRFLWQGEPAPAGSFQVYICDVYNSTGYVTLCGVDLVSGKRAVIDENGYFFIEDVPNGKKGLVMVFNPFCAVMPHDDEGEYKEITFTVRGDIDLGTFDYDTLWIWAKPFCALGVQAVDGDYVELGLESR